MTKQTIFNILFGFGGLCGIAALLFFAFSIPVKEIISIDDVDYIYDKLSFHMFFLEAILVIVGLAAAVLGIVGYQSIKDEAVSQAVSKAKDEARAYFETLDKPTKSDIPIKSPHDSSSKPEMETRVEEEE